MVHPLINVLRHRVHSHISYLVFAAGRGSSFQTRCRTPENLRQKRVYTIATAENDLPPAHGTVLMVEDEETLRMAISKMLRKRGFTVLEAADGSAALEMLRIHCEYIWMKSL